MDKCYIEKILTISELAEQSPDFVKRRLNPPIAHLALAACALMLMFAITLYQIDKMGMSFALSLLGMVLLLGLILVYSHLTRMRHIIFSNEFENALFAGAAGTGLEFMLIIHNTHQIVYYNPECREYFTYQPHAKDALDKLLYHIGMEEEDRSYLINAIKQRKHIELPFTIINAQGKEKHLRILLEPIRRPQGYMVLKALPLLKENVDVREEEETRNIPSIITPTHIPTLDEAITLMWKKLLDSSPVAIVLLNTEGKILRANKAFSLMADMPMERCKHQQFSRMVMPQNMQEVDRLIHLAVHEPEKSNYPVDVALGRKRSATFFVSPIEQDESGNLIGYIMDVTDKKNLEHRFAHSQKMQAVGQLAGGVAHDFNNLLTAMIGFTDLLLLRHPPGDQSFADIMQIKQNANRAANLVRQLLAFSRKQTLQPEVVDLTDALSELSNLIRRLIGENIEFSLSHEREIWPVKVDVGQLEQVVINLAVNARDAMEKDGGHLTITSKNVTIDKKHPIPAELVGGDDGSELPEGDYVLMQVSDTGHGMDNEMMAKIFEPFFTTKDVGSGTGLGLATVLGIVQQTGGQIFLRSVVGEGTSFHIYLPRHIDPDNKVLPKKAAVEEVQQHLAGTGSILLVEDEASVRLFSSRALQSKGYTVFEADCAEAALEIVAERGGKIDVIISDVVMPGMTGPSMVEKILSEHKNIDVIFMSGYGEDAFIKSYGKQREFNFLPKPFTLPQLAEKVKLVMEARENK